MNTTKQVGRTSKEVFGNTDVQFKNMCGCAPFGFDGKGKIMDESVHLVTVENIEYFERISPNGKVERWPRKDFPNLHL